MLVEVNSWRRAENILKIKTFHITKYKPYSHERLNPSKGVIRNRELVLATEEMLATQRKGGVTNIQKISIRKGKEQIQTNTYILTFNQAQTHKELKIAYYLERVKKYVPAPCTCHAKKYLQHSNPNMQQ